MLPAMPCSRAHSLALPLIAATIAVILSSCSQESELRRPLVAPTVAGLTDMGSPDGGLASNVRGRVLLGELGCTGCHDAGESQIEHRTGPDLKTVGGRVFGDYLDSFLSSPHAIEPGTTMPDLLRHLGSGDARTTAKAISHYLRSFAAAQPMNAPPNQEAAERGRGLYDTIGCRTCHSANEGHWLNSPKYSTETLQEFLLAPHNARPDGRMPAMELSPAQAFDLASFVLASTTDAGSAAESVEQSKVDAGRQQFAALGCANCHNLPDSQRPATAQAKPLSGLQASKGCLSGTTGKWPHYALTAIQTADIHAALQGIEQPLSGEARVQQLMASRNCFACHRRGDIDSVGRHENHFGTHDASIGQDGRIPPTLTGVGGKLQRDWLQNTIGHGQQERPYLMTRMPGFGDAFAAKLTDALTAVDVVPDVFVTPKPKNRKEADTIKKLGREIVGDKGMNCITCHLFAGEQVGAMGGIDLVHSTGKRLRPEWFAAFLRDPFRFKPITLMPEFYPNGKSTRPEFVDGDPQQQIDAMWHYLAAGRNVGKPRGMHHPAIELKVTDEAVMLRRSVQNTGKRGISVGYPGGVNITFDAENLGLNQIWWGRFVDARPVWTGQGSGQAHPLDRQRTQLANGPAFVVVGTEQPWPTPTRRERGDRFLGYELDAQQRPTFRYTSGKVTIEDKPEQTIVDGKTVLRRTVVLSGDPTVLHFLAARHQRIERIDDHTTQIGKHLRIRTNDHLIAIVPAGKEKELRVMIKMESSPTKLVLEYSWTQGDK